MNLSKEARYTGSVPNGASIIQRKGKHVLCRTQSGEFVTWAVDSEGNTYWGHYFGDDLISAAKDLQERANQ